MYLMAWMIYLLSHGFQTSTSAHEMRMTAMTMPHVPTLMGFLNACVKMDSMEMEGPAHVCTPVPMYTMVIVVVAHL